jgi:hypothetical protein
MSKSKETFILMRDEEVQAQAEQLEIQYFNSIYINNQNSQNK